MKMALPEIQSITSDDFERLLKGEEQLSIVEFAEESNGACDMMRPVFERVDSVYHQRIFFARIMLDVEDSLRQQYRIHRTPLYLFIRNGEIFDTLQGLISVEKFLTHIKQHLDKPTQ